jgi:beta-lactamase class C
MRNIIYYIFAVLLFTVSFTNAIAAVIVEEAIPAPARNIVVASATPVNIPRTIPEPVKVVDAVPANIPVANATPVKEAATNIIPTDATPSATLSSDPQSALVQQTMTTIMEEYKIPGIAVILYVHGQPSAYYFGYADDAQKTPVSSKTIFELGSVSKVMTSLLLAEQVDYAKVQLHDPITEYLDLPESFAAISLQNLATYTGGLPGNVPDSIKNTDELEAYLQAWQPPYTAGQKWIYSNVSIGLLGQALEIAADKNINELYRRRIFSPLGMQPIGTVVPAALQRYYAQGHDENGQPVQPMVDRQFPAAGGVKASAGDMQRFLAAAIGMPGTPISILYPMRMTQTAYVQLADRFQGLGWQVYELTPDNMSDLLKVPGKVDGGPDTVKETYIKPMYDGNMLMDKTGTTDGFRAYIAVVPNKQCGIVLLMNKNVNNDVLVGTARKLLFALA